MPAGVIRTTFPDPFRALDGRLMAGFRRQQSKQFTEAGAAPVRVFKRLESTFTRGAIARGATGAFGAAVRGVSTVLGLRIISKIGARLFRAALNQAANVPEVGRLVNAVIHTASETALVVVPLLERALAGLDVVAGKAGQFAEALGAAVNLLVAGLRFAIGRVVLAGFEAIRFAVSNIVTGVTYARQAARSAISIAGITDKDDPAAAIAKLTALPARAFIETGIPNSPTNDFLGQPSAPTVIPGASQILARIYERIIDGYEAAATHTTRLVIDPQGEVDRLTGTAAPTAPGAVPGGGAASTLFDAVDFLDLGSFLDQTTAAVESWTKGVAGYGGDVGDAAQNFLDKVNDLATLSADGAPPPFLAQRYDDFLRGLVEDPVWRKGLDGIDGAIGSLERGLAVALRTVGRGVARFTNYMSGGFVADLEATTRGTDALNDAMQLSLGIVTKAAGHRASSARILAVAELAIVAVLAAIRAAEEIALGVVKLVLGDKATALLHFLSAGLFIGAAALAGVGIAQTLRTEERDAVDQIAASRDDVERDPRKADIVVIVPGYSSPEKVREEVEHAMALAGGSGRGEAT